MNAAHVQKPFFRVGSGHWLWVAFCLALWFSSAAVGQPGANTQSLFNGKTLDGWKTVDPTHARLWTVKDSVLIGGDGRTKIADNTYLQTTRAFGNFEFRCLFRLSGDPKTGLINSGIQYRSVLEGDKIVGYQADMGAGFWGDIYDEHRRGKLVGGDLSVLKRLLNETGWNSYLIRCRGNHHELYINGVKTADYIEQDRTIPAKGVIAVQVHSGGAAKVEFRDLTLTEL
ncbi:protein of unknown function DUF1080 [Fibrella aestuarina BUZ 2]|uniref:3-keto-alpha-glucoside-1,2-lyase/3-keto-2-hydroxy-glucal hydratase domain-containing protein n=1 Tax=Fibrella aestuarina BUZ 2 TaxID=1166018 RepID=I0K2J6_9BACT|nr:DUF1080 domain-containing protein [Fibrella aestuarina]CCG98349.1 protein of unknown function DUF1080 [Fibrella aestuarina BUZ 2]